jgi:hypothetical protein
MTRSRHIPEFREFRECRKALGNGIFRLGTVVRNPNKIAPFRIFQSRPSRWAATSILRGESTC